MRHILKLLILVVPCFTYGQESIHPTINLHTPYEDAIRPHCTDKPAAFPTAKMEPFSNPATGFKQCEVYIPREDFYKEYEYCFITEQQWEYFEESPPIFRPPRFSCSISEITINDDEFVMFRVGGIIEVGSCSLKCL